jgi:hypothetical protein
VKAIHITIYIYILRYSEVLLKLEEGRRRRRSGATRRNLEERKQ